MHLHRFAAAATTAAALVCISGMTPAQASSSASHYQLTTAYDAYPGTTTVVRWNPCAPITYRINTAGWSTSYRVRLVNQAIGKLSAATGIRFTYLGTTSYIPHYAVLHYATGDRYVFNAAQQRAKTGAQLVIAWAFQGSNLARRESNLLTGDEAGVGTNSWRSSYSSQLRVLDGAVVLKRGVWLKSWFAPGASTGALLLHELGHVIGLRHVSDVHQIMYPVFGPYSPGVYQAGDLAGLARIGRRAGCMWTPALPAVNPLRWVPAPLYVTS